MKTKVQIYLFFELIRFRAMKHPYMTLWTGIWIFCFAAGVINGNDLLETLIFVFFIIMLPWWIGKVVKRMDGHSFVKEKIQDEEEFKKYVMQRLEKKHLNG